MSLVLLVLILVDLFLLLAIIGTLGMWMKGVEMLALPGLGIIIATPLLLVLLIIIEIVLVIGTAYLVRYIPALNDLLG